MQEAETEDSEGDTEEEKEQDSIYWNHSNG